MYTATMRYNFTEEGFQEGCALWKTIVFNAAQKAPGLVRMQFLTAQPTALAIGTWKGKKHAEDFMKTGVFKELKDALEGKLVSEPAPELWVLESFWGESSGTGC